MITLHRGAAGAFLLCASLQVGCVDGFAPTDDGTNDAGVRDVDAGFEIVVDGDVTFFFGGGGEDRARIDASASDAWVYLDLDAPARSDAESGDWDVRFQRFHIDLADDENGVLAAILPGTLDDVRQAPAEGFAGDAPDGDDDGRPDYRLSAGEQGWYDYDVSSHELTPRELVYVVRTSAGAHVALAVLAYYDNAGSSGHPMIAIRAIEAE